MILSDAVVIWRTYVLCHDSKRRWLLSLPVLCILGAFGAFQITHICLAVLPITLRTGCGMITPIWKCLSDDWFELPLWVERARVAFFILSFATNILCTGLVSFLLWYVSNCIIWTWSLTYRAGPINNSGRIWVVWITAKGLKEPLWWS